MSRSASDRIEREIWLVATVIAFGTVSAMLSVTTVTVALDGIATALGSELKTAQWTMTGYLLGLAAVVPVTGWMGRRVGAKRLYLASLALFALTSALCAFAPSIGALIALRVLQGVAGGAAIPIGQTILATAAGPGRMGRVMAVIGVPMVLAPVVGPVLGGGLIDVAGWQWLFVVNVPLALVGLVLGFRVLPSFAAEVAGPLDVRGFALLTVGVPAIVFGLAETSANGEPWHAAAAIPMIVGAAAIAGFALHARRLVRPLLSVALWRNRGFVACGVVTVSFGAAQIGALVLLALYAQAFFGASVLETGVLLIPQGVGAALTIPLAGRLTDRIGGGLVALVGVVAVVASTAALARWSGSVSPVGFAAVLVVRGMGQGAALMPAVAAVYAVLGRDEIADATPQLTLLQRLGGSVGTAILTVALTSRLGAVLPEGGGASIDEVRALVAGDALEGVAAAFAGAYWWAAAIAAAAVVPAMVLAWVERAGAGGSSAAGIASGAARVTR